MRNHDNDDSCQGRAARVYNTKSYPKLRVKSHATCRRQPSFPSSQCQSVPWLRSRMATTSRPCASLHEQKSGDLRAVPEGCMESWRLTSRQPDTGRGGLAGLPGGLLPTLGGLRGCAGKPRQSPAPGPERILEGNCYRPCAHWPNATQQTMCRTRSPVFSTRHTLGYRRPESGVPLGLTAPPLPIPCTR